MAYDSYYNETDHVIIKKKDLCQCSLSAGTWYIQENIVHCEEEASSDLQLYYTVNMAVMIYDFLKEIEEAEVRDIFTLCRASQI